MDEFADFKVSFPDPEYLRYIEGEHSLSLVVWPGVGLGLELELCPTPRSALLTLCQS